MPLTGADAAEGEAGHDDRRSRGTPDATACRARQGADQSLPAFGPDLLVGGVGLWLFLRLADLPARSARRPLRGRSQGAVPSERLAWHLLRGAGPVRTDFHQRAGARRQVARALSGAAGDRLRRADPAGLGRTLELFSAAARLYEPGLLCVFLQHSP